MWHSTTLYNHIRVKGGSIFEKKFSTIVSKTELSQFLAVFPTIVQDLTNTKEVAGIPKLSSHISDLLNYVVPRGKHSRGLTTIRAYRMLEKEENLTPANMKLAYIMGWMVEMTHASILVFDDIMDKAETRRGLPCWYKKNNIGLNSINDGGLLQQCSHILLEKYFREHSCFLPTYRIFHNAWLHNLMGQAQDISCTKRGKIGFEFFTTDNYDTTNKHKAAYYATYYPVTIAMYMTNTYNEKIHNEVKRLLVEIGEFVKIENDFLGCYGDPKITENHGSDIRKGRCSWLAVQALEKANPSQKRIMEKYYGSADPDAEGIIRNLYEELSLKNTFNMYREASLNRIRNSIQEMSNELPKNLFLTILDTIYKTNY